MDTARQGFSAQYLRQVHEEWLYVRTAGKRAGEAAGADASETAEAGYAFHIEILPEKPGAARSYLNP